MALIHTEIHLRGVVVMASGFYDSVHDVAPRFPPRGP